MAKNGGAFNITDEDPAADRLNPLSSNFQPLHDRILVYRLLDWPNDKGLIFMPECAQKPSKRGVVVRVGPGKRDAEGCRRPLDVKVGDVIYFGRYTDFDDGKFLLVQEADIVGVVSEGEENARTAKASAPATTAT